MANRRDAALADGSRALVFLLAALGLAACSVPVFPRSSDAGSVAQPLRLPGSARPNLHVVQEGFYTAEQAERGRALYEESCATCHGRGLRGSETGPPIVGAGFVLAWEGRTLAALLEYISAEMPPESGSGLSDADYADVTAYILRRNGYPQGDEELSADAPVLEETEMRLQPPPDDALSTSDRPLLPDDTP